MIPIADAQFVRRQGATLLLDEQPFRFLGNNLYFNQAAVAYGQVAAYEEALDKTAALGFTVVRANAHNDHPPTVDPAAIQSAPGNYNERNLQALDQSIALAKARNLRLILRFTNYWEAYGGIRRYVEWFLGRLPSQAETKLFYTEPVIRQWFQSYIRFLLDRRNTVTGITYRDEPAILAWELANELRSPGAPEALLEWTADMAAFLRRQDANHLIADGGEGFDDAPHLYPGLSRNYAVNGADGGSYHRLARIPELDMLSFHLYPSSWKLNDDSDVRIYITRHEEIAEAAGKVPYLGEFGKIAPDPERARIFQRWLTYPRHHALLWHLIDDARPDPENYAVRAPQDAETCRVLTAAAAMPPSTAANSPPGRP